MLTIFITARYAFREGAMHVDPQKKFDVRNIERNLREGVVTPEEYREFLDSLPDASHKVRREGDEGEGR